MSLIIISFALDPDLPLFAPCPSDNDDTIASTLCVVRSLELESSTDALQLSKQAAGKVQILQLERCLEW